MEPQEDPNLKIIEQSFIVQNYLDPEEQFTLDNYLTTTMRTSIFEKILTKYLFQSTPEIFSLYPFLEEVQETPKSKSLFISYLKYFEELFPEDSPLFFFSGISKEILRLIKEEDLSMLRISKYILKIEFLLAWHFENNFFPKSILEHLDSYNDNIYLNKGLTNYIYSVNSLDTIEKFMEVFEKQTLCTRIDGDIELINDLFCSEKIYYFYCDKTNRQKLICGNYIKYLIQQLNTKIDRFKNNKVNSYEIENYIMMNLYLINKIIQNYSFYLYKEPELTEVFSLLETFKTWPCPISNYCNILLENIINENSFQGISLLNKIRQMYYIDLMDKDINTIDTKDFRYTLVINSNEWEKRHNSENMNCFNLLKFINYLKEKQINSKNKKKQKIILKEVLIKLLISILFNSNQTFNDDNIKKIYLAYWPDYKTSTDKSNQKDTEKIKPSLDKLLKILDVGFDKPITDFDKEINLLANKIINIETSNKDNGDDDEDNLLDNEYFLPIDSLRYHLKPNYSEFKKLFRDNSGNYNVMELFDTYTKNFQNVVNTYFKYLLTNSEDTLIDNNLKTMRKNFFESFRINILLFEEDNTLNDFIENLNEKIFKVLDTKISDEDFNKFWKFFVEDKKEVIPKFLLFIVPYYEKPSSNPFRILLDDTPLNNKETYLSEFIANNDYIYKNIIFTPFASSSDPSFNQIITDIKDDKKKSDPLNKPSLNIIYSFLKKPLDSYLGDSSGIFNLNLYKVSINDNVIEKLFWKNIEFIDIANESSRQTKLTITCVDYLGLEFKEVKEIKLGNNDFNIKIYNIFFKNNVPFNYNMNSNNGWLEMFLDDKYEIKETNKFINFQNFLENNKESHYYEEFNMPQTDIETRFKNYKIKSVLIESNSPSIIIRVDDYEDLNYYDKIDLTTNKKNSNELKLKIKIEAFEVNEEKYSLPIATFTTI